MSYMKIAVREALSGIEAGDGGPFGAAVVKDGKVIGRGHNRVIADCDPTMHGEIAAIRDACRNTGSHSLKGAVLYTTAYPCPMCMCAAMWANVDKIVYGCNAHDTADIGFRDEDFYNAFEGKNFPAEISCEDREECLKLFEHYRELHGERY